MKQWWHEISLVFVITTKPDNSPCYIPEYFYDGNSESGNIIMVLSQIYKLLLGSENTGIIYNNVNMVIHYGIKHFYLKQAYT